MAEQRRLTMEEAEALPTAFPTTLVPPTTPSLRPLYARAAATWNAKLEPYARVIGGKTFA
jgi:hypothetical protein